MSSSMTTGPGRRQFLRFLGAGLSGAYAGGLGPLAVPHAAAAEGTPPFTPIRPSSRDDLVLPPGFTYQIVARWGDRLPGTSTRFGYNADYTAFAPLPGTVDEGLLFVNHEYTSLPDEDEIGVYLQSFPLVMGRSPRIEDEMEDVGVSVLHVRRVAGGRWEIVASRYTRRYDARSRMVASGPALQGVRDVGGTVADCSGCHTPWGTVLTCEENYQDVVADEVDTKGRGRVGGRFRRDGSHFGWVVEIDPFDPGWLPVKHTMLGRFRHENVAVRTAVGQPVVAYMGDDRTNGHVYRFVSAGRYAPGAPSNRGTLLSIGRLYAAVFHPDGSGEWRELAPGAPLRPVPQAPAPPVPRGATVLGQVYSDLGAIVTDAFRASNLIGATPTGRPEDIEVHPLDQSVYIAFTAAATAQGHLFPNIYGEIWRLVEEGDGTGDRFSWMRWKAGGPNDPGRAGHVFAAPDNLAFDPDGHLWVVADVTSARLNADARYATFMNNGMFFIPTSGPGAGVANQFASAPCEAELTGPSWTPDRRTMFLSVQHPGEAAGVRTAGMRAPRGSNWPSGRVGAPPLPAVVAIHRS
jgi:secreted PhoX family phosphatase